MGAVDVLVTCGFTRPISTLTLRDIPLLVESVSLHASLLVVKAELDQLVEGLRDTPVLEMMRSNPVLCRDLFIRKRSRRSSLTASE